MRHRDQWILIEGPFTSASSVHSGEITVFWPNFYDLSSSSPLRGTQTFVLSDLQVKSICESYLAQTKPDSTPLVKAPWQEPHKEDFAEALRCIQSRIFAGEIQKAVPAVFARSEQTVTPWERAQMLLQLLKAPKTLYVYGIWQNGEGLLGATPEVLFEYTEGLLKTMALAGTCPKSEAQERESLLKDRKEMQEHELVVEDLINLLQKWGEVSSVGPYVVELPTLYHLRTDLEVPCKSVPSFLSLIEKMHPTPALGVSPRVAGYQWMKSLPGQEGRRGFGAPFAFLSGEEALCLVAIRNIQWNKTQTIIGSGCGVVQDSELEREWRELYQKRLSVKKILGLEL